MSGLRKYHPPEVEYLRNLVAQLEPVHGRLDYDVHFTNRGLLITIAEPTKLYGYMGTIRGDHADEDIETIAAAAVLRFRERVAQLVGPGVSEWGLVPSSPVSKGAGDSDGVHARWTQGAEAGAGAATA